MALRVREEVAVRLARANVVRRDQMAEVREHIGEVRDVAPEVRIDRVRREDKTIARRQTWNEVADLIVAPEDVAKTGEELIRGAGQAAVVDGLADEVIGGDLAHLVVGD